MPSVLFYAVCVPVRLALAVALVLAGRRWPTPTAAAVLFGVAAGFALMALNATTRKPDAWWSRPVHALFMVAIAVAAGLALAGVVDAELLGLMVAADLAFGVGHSFIRQ